MEQMREVLPLQLNYLNPDMTFLLFRHLKIEFFLK